MNNYDITTDKKMLEGFLKEIARGGIKQDGKVISDVKMLVAGEPISCDNIRFNNLNFSNEQLDKVRAEYQKLLDEYETKLDDVCGKRAVYNKGLDEIEEVSKRLSSINREIDNLSARGISNLSSSELEYLGKLYEDRVKCNEVYLNYQKRIISYVHTDKDGIGTAFSAEINYRSLINKDTRNSYEKKLIDEYEYKLNEPFFDVSSDNKLSNILQNKNVKLISGKLTKFTKGMFDKLTGKFTAKQDGVFSKIRNFADKFYNREKLNKKVQNLRSEIIANDIIMEAINTIYDMEHNSIYSNGKGLSYDDIANIFNTAAQNKQLQNLPDIYNKVKEKIRVSLAEIKEKMDVHGYTTLEALNAALHLDENSYYTKQDLLSEYKKASTKLYRRDLRDFNKSIKDIDLSHTTEEDNSYDVRDVPNPIGEKTSADEYEEPIISNEHSNEEEKQDNEYFDSDEYEEPVISNENEEEVHENTEIQNDEPYFVRASNNYITSLEKAKGSLYEKYDEITEHLQERLELNNQQKIKYGDIVPEINEDLSFIALQKEKRNIEKELKDITNEIEDEKEKLASMKQQHILSQSKAKENAEKIQDYTDDIVNLENELRQRREENIEHVSIFGNVEDTIEDDIANDEVLNENKEKLNELTEERDVLNSESIDAKLEYIAMLEAKINSNDNLSDEEKQNACRQLWADFDEYTNSVNEESYKPRTK